MKKNEEKVKGNVEKIINKKVAESTVSVARPGDVKAEKPGKLWSKELYCWMEYE